MMSLQVQLDHTLPVPIAATIAATRKASILWSSLAPTARASQLLALHALLRTHATAIAAALTQDTARPSLFAEVYPALAHLHAVALSAPRHLTPPPARPSATVGYSIHTNFRPLPVVACIVPYNAPLFLAFLDVIPALAAGCAVIVKPSELTSRFVTPLLAALRQAPAPLRDVFVFVEGDAQVGAALVDAADAVCFTGGVSVGRQVARRCADRLIPVFLELGGKDPVIVTESANIDAAAAAIVSGSCFHAGQNCFAVERVYAHCAVYEELVARVVKLTNTLIDQQLVPPHTSLAQVHVVQKHLNDAVDKGAVVRTGGTVYVDDQGRTRVQPTVLTNVSHDMLVMREETFAPITPIMRVETELEAVRLANDTQYGLSASVFGRHVDDCVRIADRLQAGLVTVNDTCGVLSGGGVGKTSFGVSGVGTVPRSGVDGLLRFVRKTAVVVKDVPEVPSPWWIGRMGGRVHGLQFELIKRYLIGRFDNAAQVGAEREAGAQLHPFAMHVNSPLEEMIDGLPEKMERRTFHVLEETYKWKAGSRNATTIKPLLLRLEEMEDGSIMLTSLGLPDGIEPCMVRHDNPVLRFEYEELKRSETFPLSPKYEFDEERREFTLDVTTTVSESMSFRLCETLASERLTVLEAPIKDGKLMAGFCHTPLLYDRKLGPHYK